MFKTDVIISAGIGALAALILYDLFVKGLISKKGSLEDADSVTFDAEDE